MTLGGRHRSVTTVGFGDITADTTLDRVYITALMVAIPLALLPAGTDTQYVCPKAPKAALLPLIDGLHRTSRQSLLRPPRCQSRCFHQLFGIDPAQQLNSLLLQMIATCLFSRMVGDMHDLLQFASKEETALAERMEVRARALGCATRRYV